MKKYRHVGAVLCLFSIVLFSNTNIYANELETEILVEYAEGSEIEEYLVAAQESVDLLETPDETLIELNSIPNIPEVSFDIFDNWIEITPEISGEFLNDYINLLISQGKKNFLLKNGTYKLDHHILIDKIGVVLLGESKENTIIIQTSPIDDGIVVVADNVIVSSITIDNSIYNGSSAFTQSNSNNVILNDCIINGSNREFAVYFAGKLLNSGNDTINAVQSGNLDENNKIINCYIYSDYIGDGVGFALQKNGIFANNVLNGSKFSFYMCDSSFAFDNNIQNSNSQGIFYSIPAYNNVIANNRIVNALGSAIRTAKQDEHPVDYHIRASNLQIFNNTIINTNHFGIEIDQLENSIIYNNIVEDTDLVGIYLLRSDNIKVLNNNIKNPSKKVHEGNITNWITSLVGGIFADYKVVESVLDGNKITTDLNNTAFAIKVAKNNLNLNNIVINNIYTGDYSKQLQLSGNELTVSNKLYYQYRLNNIDLVKIVNQKTNNNLSRTRSGISLVNIFDHFSNALNAMTDGEKKGGLSADSWNGIDKSVDYWGLNFSEIYGFNKVVYTSGGVGDSGGWFESNLRVQVKQNGQWKDVKNMKMENLYSYSREVGPFKDYVFTFDSIWGDGVRIIGVPVQIYYRTDAFTSIAEFETFYE